MDTPIEKNSREKKEFFFQKTKPKTMLIQHVKGYPDTSMYIKNKGGITLDTDRETPCSIVVIIWSYLDFDISFQVPL